MMPNFVELRSISTYHFPVVGQNESEIIPFLEFAYDYVQTGNFCEIGTQYGGTFDTLARIFNRRKISIDIPNGAHGGLDVSAIHYRNSKLVGLHEYAEPHPGLLYLIQSDSRLTHTMHLLEDALNGEELDLLFIDGDHTYEGVKSDYISYSRFVRRGGLIAFHDIVDRPENSVENVDVPRFWRELQGTKHEFVCNCSWTSHTPVIGGIGVIVND